VPFGGIEAYRETAQRIEQENPRWIVVWGVYSQEFVAFPKFRAPSGTVLHTRNSKALVTGMRQIEFTFTSAAPLEGDPSARQT